MSCLDDLGEDAVVGQFRDWLKPKDGGADVLGDDCAVMPGMLGDADGLLTSDAVIEGIHFESGTALDRVGHKGVARALSDIASMGGQPLYALLNLGAPGDLPAADLKKLMTAARNLADVFGARIVGGDLTRMDRLELNVFVLGTVPSGQALLRSGARAGDKIYVTGQLGGSLQGHHLDFTPRVREAVWLRERKIPNAMMDLSDGLAADLPRLAAESSVGACIDVSRLPVSGHVKDKGAERALFDGEDYELLFTVAGESDMNWVGPFEREFGIAVTCIGEVTPAADGLGIIAGDGARTPWPAGGYTHF